MLSDLISIANISEEIIVEEDFPSHEAQEVKEEVDLKVEDKSSSIAIDDLVSVMAFSSLHSRSVLGKEIQ